MNQFFKELAELMIDRQECVINIKKIDGDLVIMVTPDIKKKGTALQMTGNPDEMDLNFIHELKKPVTAKAEFKAESVENPDLEDEDDTAPRKPGESTKEYQGRLTGKKNGKKKTAKPGADKKGKGADKAKKKEEPTIANGKKLMRTEKDEKEFSAKIEADKLQREKNEAAEKLKANKEAFDKAMADGKAHMEGRRYAEAEVSFKTAVDLFPDNEKAKKEWTQANKWVGAMAKL